MCQVHTGTYVALLAPEKTDCTTYHPDQTTEYALGGIRTHETDLYQAQG